MGCSNCSPPRTRRAIVTPGSSGRAATASASEEECTFSNDELLEGERKLSYTAMTTNTQSNVLKGALRIRFHLTDGSFHSFVQTDNAVAGKIWEGVDPARLFARPRIVISSEHSKAVFVSAEIIRVDFIH